MKAADELAKHVGVKPACAALEVSRSTLYRRRGPSTGQQQPRPTPARALSETERGEVFDTLCSERFVDRSPAEVVATLLDEEVYLCSERTMYRVLASEVPVQERRAQRTHPEYKKPELMATAPNQVWSWDITRLLGPKKWSYYYLYVALLHGLEQRTDPPSPERKSLHAVAVRHPKQGHRVENLARQMHLNSLSVDGSTSHTSTDDRLVSEDGILHQAALAVA